MFNYTNFQGWFWGGATGAIAPVTLSLDSPVAPPTGSLHNTMTHFLQ